MPDNGPKKDVSKRPGKGASSKPATPAEPIEDAEIVEAEAEEAAAQDTEAPESDESLAPEVQESAPQEPHPVPPTPPPRSPVPITVLAVLVAVLLGAGATWLILGRQPAGNQDEIDRLSAQIAALSEAVAAGQGADPAADAVNQLQGAIGGEIAGLGETIGGLSERLAAVDARMAQIENRPDPETPAEFGAAIDLLGGELEAAQARVAELMAAEAHLEAEIQRLTDENEALRGERDAALARADELGKADQITTAERMAAAVTRLQAAVMNGRPFPDQAAGFEERTGVALPEPLAAVAKDGVLTEAALKARFPDHARRALAAALRARQDAGPLGRAADFLRAQVGLRSITPREGDGPDAVLSRAQGAVDAGDFDAALAEIETLPPAAQTEMQPWAEAAAARLAAVQALNDLAGG